jgi:hypothetical protein
VTPYANRYVIREVSGLAAVHARNEFELKMLCVVPRFVDRWSAHSQRQRQGPALWCDLKRSVARWDAVLA